MHYYKRNIGDYAKKAGRLSILEHGAYTLLIDACYDRERFPTKDEALDWTWARTEDEVRAVEFVLSRFFDKDEDGRYVQSRIQEEIEKYHQNAETNKRIAREREEKRRTNRSDKSTKRDPESTKRDRSVNEPSTKQHEPPPNQEPETINQEPNNSSSPSAAEGGESSPPGKPKTKQPDPVDLDLAEFILAGVRRLKPDLKTPNLKTWASDCRKMRALDSRSPEQIRRVFDWANRDSFWQVNILSPGKLREKFDDLEMRANRGNPSENRRPPPKKSVIERIGEQARQGMANAEAREAAERPVATHDPVVRPQVGVSGGGHY